MLEHELAALSTIGKSLFPLVVASLYSRFCWRIPRGRRELTPNKVVDGRRSAAW
jgi:hypothetical protein